MSPLAPTPAAQSVTTSTREMWQPEGFDVRVSLTEPTNATQLATYGVRVRDGQTVEFEAGETVFYWRQPMSSGAGFLCRLARA